MSSNDNENLHYRFIFFFIDTKKRVSIIRCHGFVLMHRNKSYDSSYADLFAVPYWFITTCP